MHDGTIGYESGEKRRSQLRLRHKLLINDLKPPVWTHTQYREMTTFSKGTFQAAKYNQFRPLYPGSFYRILGDYLKKSGAEVPVAKTADVGCGTGVALYPLLDLSKQVIGVDLSQPMVDTANSVKEQKLQPDDASRISFRAMDVADWTDSNVDLITAAQCIHWFDIPKFFAACGDILVPHSGVLAFFFYVDPVICNAPRAKEAQLIYDKYIYGDSFIGPYWEQPGRGILKHLCKDVTAQIPQDIYEEVEVNTFWADQRAPSPKDLVLERKQITIDELFLYLKTYSGYHNYAEAKKDKGEIFDEFAKELGTIGWDKSTKFDIVWNTGYTFMKRR